MKWLRYIWAVIISVFTGKREYEVVRPADPTYPVVPIRNDHRGIAANVSDNIDHASLFITRGKKTPTSVKVAQRQQKKRNNARNHRKQLKRRRSKAR